MAKKNEVKAEAKSNEDIFDRMAGAVVNKTQKLADKVVRE